MTKILLRLRHLRYGPAVVSTSSPSLPLSRIWTSYLRVPPILLFHDDLFESYLDHGSEIADDKGGFCLETRDSNSCLLSTSATILL